MWLPGITVSAITDDHKLNYQAFIASKFGKQSTDVNVTVHHPGRPLSGVESVAISYSVTGLEDVVASKRIVEEIIGQLHNIRSHRGESLEGREPGQEVS